MSWRCDHFTDPDTGALIEAHVVPEPSEADGWDGFEDERPRQYAHWHEQTTDALRGFYEIPDATVATLLALLSLDADTHSFHDALAVLELRLR